MQGRVLAEKKEGNLEKGRTVANDSVTIIASLIVTNVKVKGISMGETG